MRSTPASGSGTSITVRDGWSSAIPARVDRARSSHSSGAQTTCVITLVRRLGGRPASAAAWRSSASAASTSLRRTASPVHVSRSMRAALNAAARTGRRGAAGRPLTAAPIPWLLGSRSGPGEDATDPVVAAAGSMPPPGTPVAVQEVVRRRRPPRTCWVVRERGAVATPGGDDRVDQRPLLLDLIRAREQRLVAEHRVEDEPLVGLRQAGAERAAVEEV